MSTFKVKATKSIKNYQQTNTLDEAHRKYITIFQKRKTQLPNKKAKLDTLENQLQKLEMKNPVNYTSDDTKLKADLKSKIKLLLYEIYDIENNISEMEYYSKIEDIIMDYYDILDNDDHILYKENPEMHSKKESTANNQINDEPDRLDKLVILGIQNENDKKLKKVTKRRKKK